MATGFECEFAEKVSKGIQFECPICLLVLREPYQATCCGKSFCKECIESVKARSNKCPTCKAENFFSYPNLGLQQSLYDFQVYCMHKSKGCEWTGELRELDNHLNSDPPADKSLQGCPYTLIKCPLGCAGCEKGVIRRDVKSHVNDKLLSHVMMQNSKMLSFEQQLQKDRSIITELKAQLEEGKRDKEHLEERVAKLEAKNRELDVAMAASKPQAPIQIVAHITGTFKPVGATFTMTDFEEFRRDGDQWFSPQFYTHPNGYKMCLRIDANGDGSGRGTYLSVYVYLLQGEFDDHLKWPFQGIVYIKLVNQEEDRDHVIKTLDYGSAPSQCCMRVMSKKRIENGYGFCQTLSHADLQPKYLKNDCIKLCVKKIELY